MDEKPYFIIIAAMECATTALHEQLARQSLATMRNMKGESHWYLSLFYNAKGRDICGKPSCHCTKLPTG